MSDKTPIPVLPLTALDCWEWLPGMLGGCGGRVTGTRNEEERARWEEESGNPQRGLVNTNNDPFWQDASEWEPDLDRQAQRLKSPVV